MKHVYTHVTSTVIDSQELHQELKQMQAFSEMIFYENFNLQKGHQIIITSRHGSQ